MAEPSPIFGLQMVSLADVGVMASLAAASAIAITLGTQLQKQYKIDSAGPVRLV